MIDTHSHVLPLVDHGSPDLETTLRMIRAAADQGTTTICCTPHLYEYDAGLVQRAREIHRQVSEEVRVAGLPVRLLLGFEVDLTVAATSDAETLLGLCIESKGLVQTDDASAGRAMVIEMPYSNWPPFLVDTVARLTSFGVLPLIAHPERNDRVQRDPDILVGCMEAGGVLQGTSGSLSQMFRKQAQRTFYELLARGWLWVLASDAHSSPKYTWSLGPMLADLGSRLSPDDRELLVNVNPGRVLEGRPPIPLVARRSPRKGRRLFG